MKLGRRLILLLGLGLGVLPGGSRPVETATLLAKAQHFSPAC